MPFGLRNLSKTKLQGKKSGSRQHSCLFAYHMFIVTIIMSIMVAIIQYQRAKIDKSKGKHGCSLPEIKVRVNYVPSVGLDCIYTVEKVHVHCVATIINIQTPSSAAMHPCASGPYISRKSLRSCHMGRHARNPQGDRH